MQPIFNVIELQLMATKERGGNCGLWTVDGGSQKANLGNCGMSDKIEREGIVQCSNGPCNKTLRIFHDSPPLEPNIENQLRIHRP